MERQMAMSVLESMEKRYFDTLIDLCIAGDPEEKIKAHRELRIREEDLRNWTEKMLQS